MVEQQSIWRSEPMIHMRLQMQREDAHDITAQLGHLGLVQFNDANSTKQMLHRAFTPHVKRCNDIERRLEYFYSQIKMLGIPLDTYGDPKQSEVLSTQLRKGMLEALELQLERIENELRDLSSKNKILLEEMNKHREMKEVFSRDSAFYFGESYKMNDRSAVVPLSTTLSIIVGVIPQEVESMLQRLTYRLTRGNSYIRTDPIIEPFCDTEGEACISKSVFAIFVPARSFLPKITKICESLDAHIYPYAELDGEKILPEIESQSNAMMQTIQHTQACRYEILRGISANLAGWTCFVKAEKGVFDILNRIAMNGMIATADIWIPAYALDTVERTLQNADAMSNAQISSMLTHIDEQSDAAGKTVVPTHYRTNKFTSVFQDIAESYGVARYREINPAVFSAMTFPYLFGVMYGDVGHGAIMTITSLMLIIFETKLAGSQNEIFSTVFHGRYLIFLMGLFSIYIGLLYNDTFGISTDIFPSGYVWGNLKDAVGKQMTPINLSGVEKGSNTTPTRIAPFGIDSAWAETENKLEFYNSLKMKCAIVIGVIQMIAGLILSMMNHIHFNDWRRVYFQFIPELIFLLCTFGYMAIIIVVKWCTPFVSTNKAPSLLETMTNFFLAPGTVTQPLYRGQALIQVVLLLVAFLMIPLMLIPIPYLAWRDKRCQTQRALISKKARSHSSEHYLNSHCNSHGDVYERESNLIGSADDGEFQKSGSTDNADLSEICIHQIIHTIEFVLGAVSNTASYLRLWALSLAHAQLSDVFWNFAFMAAMSADKGSGVIIFIGVAIWLVASIFVLLMMESLSAFLHTLRLHWVEFQNKFYYGDGIKFTPFDLSDVGKNRA